MVARPTITPSAPVWARQARAASGPVMSPLAITGIERAALTRAIACQSARPWKPCSRVRPCRVSSWAPACCRPRQKPTGSASAPHQPRRVLTVTGSRTAATTAATISIASCGCRNRPLPPPLRAILRTGQPMLMSIQKAPAASARRAASAIAPGRWSNSCTATGPGSSASDSTLPRPWPSSRLVALTISVNRSAPGAQRRTRERKMGSLTPARGDCSTRQPNRRGVPWPGKTKSSIPAPTLA